MTHFITLRYVQDCIVCYLKIMLQLSYATNIIQFFTIEDHEREHKFLSDKASSGGDRPLPLNSKKEYLI